MVEVDEWVAHVVDQVRELLLELGVLGGVEDKFLGVHLDVVCQVEVFVSVADLGQSLVGVHAVSLGRQEQSQVDLELLEERLHLLQVELELSDAVGVLLPFLDVIVLLVDLSSHLNPVVGLRN